jgi:DNA topoisomerase I
VGTWATSPVIAARKAGLRYVSDRMPGLHRIGTGKTFRYIGTDGHVVRNVATIARIRSLAIPPAWTDVWICPLDEGHIQAVGRDARKRKQYRYHPRWREVRDATKFYRMADFEKVLPKIRAHIRRDLASSGLSKQKVIATIVRLLETTLIRVGNDEYVKQNHSFGLTTLRNHHVEVNGTRMHFYFRGKSGVKHEISVQDPHLAKIVRRLRDLPGYELFQYVDEAGERRSVGSADVNEYIREITGEDFTAKDFRTWAGTLLAADALFSCKCFETQTEAKRNVSAALQGVAERLGNTVAVCRKCYVHPAVLEGYSRGKFTALTKPPSPRVLSKWEKEFARRSNLTLEQALVKSIKSRRKK